MVCGVELLRKPIAHELIFATTICNTRFPVGWYRGGVLRKLRFLQHAPEAVSGGEWHRAAFCR
jgi:hypothetical protein